MVESKLLEEIRIIQTLAQKIKTASQGVHDNPISQLYLTADELKYALQALVFKDPGVLAVVYASEITLPEPSKAFTFNVEGGASKIEFQQNKGVNMALFVITDTNVSMGIGDAQPRSFPTKTFGVRIGNKHNLSDGARQEGQISLMGLTIDPSPNIDAIPGLPATPQQVKSATGATDLQGLTWWLLNGN